MKETSYTKLENQISRVVDDHINDGQLSNCPLTFRQIQIIKDTFLSILKGVYHSRIEYPDDDKKQDNTQKESRQKPAETQEVSDTEET